MSAPQLGTLRLLACEAARIGGRIAADAFGGRVAFEFKSDRSEVTEHDRAAEQAILAFLREQRPGDAFIGEEASANPQSEPEAPARAPGSGAPAGGIPRSRVGLGLQAGSFQASRSQEAITWVVDPIDGTRNFTRGAPFFACSVGAMQGGLPIAGAIYDPLRDQMYSAAHDGGAFLNGHPLQLPPPPAAAPGTRDANLLIAIPSLHEPATAALVRLAIERHVVRNLGSSTLHLAMVASGHIDAALMNNCKLWDIVAGWVIVQEAGGILGDPCDRWRFPLDCEAYAGESLPTLAATPEAWRRLIQSARSR